MSAFDPTFDPIFGLGPTPDGAAPPGGPELAMLAHDIRGALHGVMGGMGQIEASDLPPPLREQVERVATAARSLASLTAMMLGDAPDPVAWATGEHVQLPAFLRYVRSRWTGEAQGKGLGFDVVPAADLPPSLRMDHLPLARALGNLISNAIKHSDAGSVRVSVTREADGGVAFRVADDGPGLVGEVLHRVSQGERPAGADGHGLGLHIVRQIADKFGGSLTIANRAPRGVEAVLRLPAAIVADPEPGAAAAPLAQGRPDLDGMRVLLAEDSPTNQMVATQMLRALNAEVTVCSDGVEALELFEAASFDVVVVDIEMPRLSGLDVIRTIRARTDGRAGVPIVALTAYALREHRDRVLDAGANGLISKPISSIEALGRDLAAHVSQTPAPAAVPEAEPGAEAAVVDLATYDALVQAIGQEMMGELLDKVVADLISARGDLSRALDPLDRGPIRSASHILISVAGAVGANRLQAAARSLNGAAHAVADDGIAERARRCIAEVDAAAAFVRGRRSGG